MLLFSILPTKRIFHGLGGSAKTSTQSVLNCQYGNVTQAASGQKVVTKFETKRKLFEKWLTGSGSSEKTEDRQIS